MIAQQISLALTNTNPGEESRAISIPADFSEIATIKAQIRLKVLPWHVHQV